MPKKYIIGGIIGAAFIVIAILSFNTSKIDYSDFPSAEKETGKTFQVIGSWVKDKNCNYNSQINKFSFFMLDEKNNERKVVFSGPKPNNFEIAPKIVVKGAFDGETFFADDIMTKCPSKYSEENK